MATHIPMPSWVWIDGRPVPGEEARISVFDRGFLYGDSIYEVTRTVRGRPLFLPEHLQRLERSAAGLLMAAPPRPQIEVAVDQTLAALLAQPGVHDAYLRIVVTRGAGEISLDPAAADQPCLVIVAKPLRLPEARLYKEGAAALLVPLRRNAEGHVPAAVKSGNYLTSVLAMAEVRRRGAPFYEALLTGDEGQIAEGASSNFFAVLPGGRVRTPPLGAGILAGITRQVVLGLLHGLGDVYVEEAPLYPADVAQAEEAFLTSSIRGVMPVVQVDDARIGAGVPGPLTRRLMATYAARIGEASPG